MFEYPFGKQVLLILPHLVMGIVIFIGLSLLGWLCYCIIKKLASKMPVDTRAGILLLGQIIMLIFMLIGLISGLSNIGVKVATLVTGLGLTGIGLGIATKDILSNIIVGTMILIYNPFRQGDLITIGGNSGVVAKITLRHIVLQTDNSKILIPNSNFLDNPITILENKHYDK